VPVAHCAPQQSNRIGDHEPGRLHRVFGLEVVVPSDLAGQIDQQFQGGRCRVCILGVKTLLCVGGQPPEREPPRDRSFGDTRRSPAR
jgi:hypothetical protein